MTDPAFSSNPATTASRIALVDQYMAANVLNGTNFVCGSHGECTDSHPGQFFEGQLHHIGRHYDLTMDGKPFRIAIVGQEYGNGPKHVSREARTRDVVEDTGLRKRFFSDGGYPARNPHMRGTTSLLRLLIGREPGRNYDGELVSIGGSSIHIFEMFALTNFLLCSAVALNVGKQGSKRGQSTREMQRNCAGHFCAVMRILEPTVIVAQGKGVRKWMRSIVESLETLGPCLERVRLGGHSCLLASFTHPSVPSKENWGTDEKRPYLLGSVRTAVDTIRSAVRAESASGQS